MKENRGTTTAIERVVKKLDLVVDENRRGLRDFSGGGLYGLSLFVSEARLLVASLTRLSAQIERDPSRFLFGDTQKGFEAR